MPKFTGTPTPSDLRGLLVTAALFLIVLIALLKG